MEREYEVIITIVNDGFADLVMDAAKSHGARGGTVMRARGSGIHEAEKFFGIEIQPEKDFVLTLVKKEHKNEIMRAILNEAGLKTPGKGICFSISAQIADSVKSEGVILLISAHSQYFCNISATPSTEILS